MRNTAEVLTTAAATFKQRQPIYGDNAPRVGAALAALFPKGLTLNTADDFTRFYLYSQMVAKLGRYANNFQTPHMDSTLDATVYAAMLHATDQEKTPTPTPTAVLLTDSPLRKETIKAC